jgi:hypothetical protein
MISTVRVVFKKIVGVMRRRRRTELQRRAA